jgi:hypothetical protein
LEEKFNEENKERKEEIKKKMEKLLKYHKSK